MGKDSQYVRIGIQKGILKFGTAMRMGDSRENIVIIAQIREYGKRQVILTKVLKITKFILTFLKNNANINI